MRHLQYLRDCCTDMLAEMRADVRKLYTRTEMREVLDTGEYAAMVHSLRPVNEERSSIIAAQYGGISTCDLPDPVRLYFDNLCFAQKMTQWFDRHIPKTDPKTVQGASMIAQRAGYGTSIAREWAALSDEHKRFFGPEKPLLRDATDYPGLMIYMNKPIFELFVFGNFAWQIACINALEAKLQSINEQLGL